MKVDVEVATHVSTSARARQLEAMFDVPYNERQRLSWRFDAPVEARDWHVGLIVGPSGSGKTTILNDAFGVPRTLTWAGDSVVDDFDDAHTMEQIAAICRAVGFNTIPAWLRPFDVLSTGEQFRVTMARLLADADDGDVVTVDEFTSVVDRQVAQIGAYAVAKHVRRAGMRFVAATCHFDVIDWLQPDWVIEPAAGTFEWRSVQSRPPLDVTVEPTGYATWQLFAQFHYLTASLNRAARCYLLRVDGRPAAFAGVLHRPHRHARNVKGLSRVVTLPDWQGLGLAFVLMDTLAAGYKATGQRFRTYPAHPALIHAFDKSPRWSMQSPPGHGRSLNTNATANVGKWVQGLRPSARFEWIGDADDDAAALVTCHA